MIVPMKKVYLITQKKNAVAAAESLGELGVVHVESEAIESTQDLIELREEVLLVTRAVHLLSRYDCSRQGIRQEQLSDWKRIANTLVSLESRLEHLRESLNQRKLVIEQYEVWGDFDPHDIGILTASGIYVYLCKIPKKEKEQIPSEGIVHVIRETGKDLYCILIARENKKWPFDFIPFPEMSLHQMKSIQEQERLEIEKIEKDIRGHCLYFKHLSGVLQERSEALGLEEVVLGMKEADGLALLRGYCPVDQAQILGRRAKEEHWGLLVEDPSDDDRVPTLIRNPQWVEIIRPLFTLMNVLPGYKEVDISPIFLIFFSIFFGILIGDAGYGFIFFGLTFFLQNKFKNKMTDQAPFFLFYVLSSSAIIWGLLTGTFFGTLLLGKFVKPVFQWLMDNAHVQLLCFLIGAIHLSIARGWQFLMKMSTPFAALAEIGWMVVVWGGFFLVNAMVIGTPVLGMDMRKSLIVVGCGVGLVLVDILVRSRGKAGEIGIGCILLFFSTLSACTDVVSYIRLFAVGLAGLAVADAFNEIALSIGFNSILTGLVASLILVAGHVFNIILGCFGLLVHGLRLNVLEFSGHVGLEWKGFKYQPFKKTNVVSV